MTSAMRLGEVADVVSGVGFPKELQGQSEGEVPVFKVGDISNAVKGGSRYLRASPNHLSKEAARKLAANLMPAGTTVFAKIGEGLKLNRRAILGQPSLVDNNVMGLVPRVGVATSAYLYYFMQTVDLGALSQATAVPSVRKSDVLEISIPVPPVERQHEIVAEIEKQFSRLDEAVANLHRVKANLKRYRSAVLSAAVGGRLVARSHGQGGADMSDGGTERLRAEIADARYKSWSMSSLKSGRYKQPVEPLASRLRELPSGWAWATIEEIGLAERPCAYGVLQPGDDRDVGVPFVRVGDINDGRVDRAGLKRIDPAIAARYPRTQLRGGELLITLVGSIGRTAIAPAELNGANVARAVGVVPLSPNVNARWVEVWFRSPDQLREMDGRAHEVARKTLNLEDVRQATVALPPLAEQRQIVDEVEARLTIAEAAELAADGALVRANRLRASILENAFFGTNKKANA